MKLRALFAAIACALITSWASADSLTLNDPSISDGPCTYPPPIAFPTQMVNTLKGLPQFFRVYLPFGNKAYYRWIYQKVNGGAPATDASEIVLTRPRVTFPNLLSVLSLAVGIVDVYGPVPTGKWYQIQAIPLNLAATDLIVKIVFPSLGAAPFGFGGANIPSRTVWADATAFVEWHCFVGDVQVVNVVSLMPALTSGQVSAITTFLQGYGIQPQNLMTMPY